MKRRIYFRKDSYHAEYLHSERWASIRSRVLKKWKNACYLCGFKDPGNDIHHLTYRRLGRELIKDLMVLCRGCHDIAHTDSSGKRSNHPRVIMTKVFRLKGTVAKKARPNIYGPGRKNKRWKKEHTDKLIASPVVFSSRRKPPLTSLASPL